MIIVKGLHDATLFSIKKRALQSVYCSSTISAYRVQLTGYLQRAKPNNGRKPYIIKIRKCLMNFILKVYIISF